MKKLRLFILTFIITMLCTGCSIEYNITIGENTIEESIVVDDFITGSRSKNEILDHYNMWYPVFVNYVDEGESIELEDFSEKVKGIEYYNKNIEEISNGYKYTYKYTYDIDDYYDSFALATTFIEPNVYKTNKNLVLKSGNENLLCNYDYFDELTINITVNQKAYKLNYTNAQKQKDNTYTWTLNRNNCQDSKIILTLDDVNPESNIDGSNSLNNTQEPGNVSEKSKDYSMYIFYGILVILILIGYFIIKKLKEKNSKVNEDD